MDITGLFFARNYAFTDDGFLNLDIVLGDLTTPSPGRVPDQMTFPTIVMWQGRRTEREFTIVLTVTRPDGSTFEHRLDHIDEPPLEHSGIDVVELSGEMVAPSQGRFRLDAQFADPRDGSGTYMEYTVKPRVVE